MSTDDFRTEHDSMGDIQVPRDALWRAQTQRAIENFPISGTPIEPRLIHAIGHVKAAAATVNGTLGVITAERSAAIATAAASVAAGEHDAAFPIDTFQTGSGTSSNMNANEVIASLAGRGGVDVHPNDHVNASQSSNDTFPTAIHVAATLAVVEDLEPALAVLQASLSAKADEFAGLVKSGRTHLMDATPVMLGQEFGGYAATVAYAVERLEAVLPRVRELPLGGTAVGTGINTPAGFPQQVIAELSSNTGQPFTEARNHFEAQGTRDSLVELSGVLRTIAVGLTKICNDLRWMSSGPTTGLSEIHLPDLQPGSSIMPGKVNPVLPEATLMVCAQVIGNDVAVTVAGASGAFELNVAMPVIARNVLESTRLLARTSTLLAQRCVDGITANADRMRAYAESSPSVVTPLNTYVGYEAAAKIAKQSLADGATIRETVLKLGYVDRGELTEQQLDEALDVESMTHPVSMNDAAYLREQYATEANLQTRQSVWQPSPDGRDAASEALATIVGLRPGTMLEVGCGTGGFAARLSAALPEARLVAVDQSPRFVELTASRGLIAEVADVQDLPFPDGSFDVVAAMWMLYHVADLDRGLAEIHRVLRPGGTLVAVTNGDEHVADLRRDAGGGPVITQFSSENAEASLARHFDTVIRDDLRPRAVFVDHAAAMAYLESSSEDVDWLLAPFDGPREYAGHATVFTAR